MNNIFSELTKQKKVNSNIRWKPREARDSTFMGKLSSPGTSRVVTFKLYSGVICYKTATCNIVLVGTKFSSNFGEQFSVLYKVLQALIVPGRGGLFYPEINLCLLKFPIRPF